MKRVLAVLAAALVPALTATGAASAQPAPSRAADLDVLFIGAHPDDEAGDLSTYGAWAREYGLRTGVVTVTRGEGGGNAVGPEEGPPLGLLREAEERRAVGRSGIRAVYNLDKVDFYYTVSAPLTQAVWNERDALERVVRVVRATRPEVIVTMNPSPSPGNHGNHQQAARLAVEAYRAAADPAAFRAQTTSEGLAPWRVKRLFRSGAATTAEDPPTGPGCARRAEPSEPTDQVFGVWSGARGPDGKTWAQIEIEAQRDYASQGWSGFEDAPADPAEIECDLFTQLAARVPHRASAPGRAAMVEGALRARQDGLPLGTELSLTPERFNVAPGRPLRVTVRARGPRRLGPATVRLDLPAGWRGDTTARLGRLRASRDARATLRLRAPAKAVGEATRVRIAATLRAGARAGSTSAVVRLVPPVRGTLEPLPQATEFRAWTRRVGAEALDGLVDPVATLGAGQRRSLRVELENRSREVQAGTVGLKLPAGFAADAPAKGFERLAPGERKAVRFEVVNTDPGLTTSKQGGDYPLEIVTTTDGAASTEAAALELVPVTSVPRAAAAPVVDGVAGAGEYTGPALDLSRIWEGEDPPTASGTARLAWGPGALYALVDVRDDVLGTVLPRGDAKRHWRTDSVELAVDPGGASENTSTTFKVGMFPVTAEGGPFAYRDADNRQGPVARTAAGMRVASRVRQPYDGYTLELAIPFADLPAAVRPGAIGLNVFVYDSDTQDKTGQNRHGWSTWQGVQGDPYRWGRAALEGFTSVPGQPEQPVEPDIPSEVARSVESPQSIAQATRDRVGLAGGPRVPGAVQILGRPRRSGDAVLVRLRAGERGTVHVFATGGGDRVLGSRAVRAGRGPLRVRLHVPRIGDARRILVALEAAGGGTDSAAARVGR